MYLLDTNIVSDLVRNPKGRVAKRIRQVVSGAKILFLTVISQAEVAQAALSSGGQGYVLKQNAGSELWPAIEAVLQGKQYVSSGLAG